MLTISKTALAEVGEVHGNLGDISFLEHDAQGFHIGEAPGPGPHSLRDLLCDLEI
jgi:hypothetical protein